MVVVVTVVEGEEIRLPVYKVQKCRVKRNNWVEAKHSNRCKFPDYAHHGNFSVWQKKLAFGKYRNTFLSFHLSSKKVVLETDWIRICNEILQNWIRQNDFFTTNTKKFFCMDFAVQFILPVVHSKLVQQEVTRPSIWYYGTELAIFFY